MTANVTRRRKKSVNPILAIRRRKAEAWLNKNRAALAAYNEYVEKHGVFSDGLRSF